MYSKRFCCSISFGALAIFIIFLNEKIAVDARPQIAVFVDPSAFSSRGRSGDLTGADIWAMIYRSLNNFYSFFEFN